MIKKYLLNVFICLITNVFLFGFAYADERLTPKGYHGDWRVYTAMEGKGKVCFMVTSPQHTNVERQDNYLAITHRPFEKSFDVVTLSLGVPFQKNSKPTIEVDNKKTITMIPVEDDAFIKDHNQEKTLIQQMMKGNVARTQARSKKGTLLRDTYSLKGFQKAYDLLNKVCSAKEH